MKYRILSMILVILILGFLNLSAQIPRIINYQGKLLGQDEQPVPEREYKLTFSIYTEDGTLLWSEIHQSVFIAGGVFQAHIGSMQFLDLPFDQPYFLGITVGDDEELTPRMLLTSAAYSFNAEKINGIRASAEPEANSLYPLGNDGKFQASVLPSASAGNFIKKNEPDTSRATSTSPLLLISNLGTGDGINGRSVDGTGIAGRSDNSDGVSGRTDASGKSGVFGFSTDGRGVVGRSNNNDGVVGWTDADSKSGVYGHTSNSSAYSIFGRNEATESYGYIGGGHAVYGKTNSVYHGGHFETSGGFSAAVYGKTTGAMSYAGFFLAAGNYTYGIYAEGPSGQYNGCAALFKGNVEIRSLTSDETVVELGEGLDYSEGFDVVEKSEIAPGTILVIDSDNPGNLAVSAQAYDKKVAGIVAGGKGLNSGVKLGSSQFDLDVALAGRVYCFVDASYGEVLPGDLLTTSSTPGFAMAVKNFNKAQGAILGKAMEKLAKGEKGQILVLVTLQ